KIHPRAKNNKKPPSQAPHPPQPSQKDVSTVLSPKPPPLFLKREQTLQLPLFNNKKKTPQIFSITTEKKPLEPSQKNGETF
ncbi:hypothetical protein, partial [Listeria monocytogenes]|uniref:hypothetical protein n=1 Tax=Listeria monocytogenes TaxID=1639 RepID=UPI001C0A93A1